MKELIVDILVLLGCLCLAVWVFNSNNTTLYDEVMNRCISDEKTCACIADILTKELSEQELRTYFKAIDNGNKERFILSGLFAGNKTATVVSKAMFACVNDDSYLIDYE